MENGIIFSLKLKRKTQNSRKKLNVSEDLSSPTLPSDVKKSLTTCLMTWSMFYLEIFMLIHMAHWKSCLTFYQCKEYTITVYYCLSGALRMGCHWLINVRWWSRKMVDQNAFLYSLSVWASLCIPAACPYVYLVHHVVFNYPIFHLYHWIRMSFKCPSGKCCHLTILFTKNKKCENVL